MDWSSLNPYEVVGSADSLSYFFVTSSGHHYRAYFLAMSTYVPSFKHVYAFNLEPEEDTPHSIDPRIACTVAFIIRAFFSSVNNGILYICDTTDGRGRLRQVIFDRWFRIFNNGSAVKYDYEVQTDDYLITASLILLKDNEEIESIVQDFFLLVSNGMIPEE